MIGKVVTLAGLMLIVTLGSGCTTISDAEEKSDEVAAEEDERPYVTLFLLFPEPCPPDYIGMTTHNSTESSSAEARSCGPNILDHIPDEQRCGTFQIHGGVQLLEGEGISVNVTIRDGPGYVTPRFVWRDGNGTVAEAVSWERLVRTRQDFPVRASTIVDRNSSDDLWFDVYSDGGKCDGVQYAGSNPSRFCTHPPDHDHGVVPHGGHCTPW